MILFNMIYVLAALFNLELNEFYMLRGISFCLISFFLILNINAQQFGVLTDSRDGRVYKTVKIGEQIWMAENLHAFNFRNGDPVPIVKTDTFWNRFNKPNSPGCSYYENNLKFGVKYGLLYNWDAINDPRGLAPEGWHIPTAKEWKILIANLGGREVAGAKLKSTEGWESFESEINCDVCHEWTSRLKAGKYCNKCLDSRKIKGFVSGNGNNISGFSALPGGQRTNKSSLGFISNFWSLSPYDYEIDNSTINQKRDGWGYYSVILNSTENTTNFYFTNPYIGISVRCVKD